jgi:hypothetical protein
MVTMPNMIATRASTAAQRGRRDTGSIMTGLFLVAESAANFALAQAMRDKCEGL